jgi:acetolactate synthase I/II/III large subunit
MNGAQAWFKAITDAGLDTCFANDLAKLHNAGRANTTMVNVVGANATYHQPNFAEHAVTIQAMVDQIRKERK